MTTDMWKHSGKDRRRPGRPSPLLRAAAVRNARAVSNRTKQWAWILVRYLLVIGISFVILYPLLVKLSVSFMTEKDLMDLTVKWIPRTFTLENYRVAFQALKLQASALNSLFYTVGITAIQLISCTLAAYGLARYPYPGSRLLMGVLIFTLVVPPQTYMSALYVEYRFFDPLGLVSLARGQEGLVNTLWPFVVNALLCQGIRNGLYIFLMVQYFRQLPAELEEAANVDGAGLTRIFTRIMLPNAVPILVTVGVLSVVWQWNDSFYTSMLAGQMDFLSTNVQNVAMLLKENQTLDYMAQDTARVSAAKNAAAMLMCAPIILFFACVQKFFSENLARSGIVG